MSCKMFKVNKNMCNKKSPNGTHYSYYCPESCGTCYYGTRGVCYDDYNFKLNNEPASCSEYLKDKEKRKKRCQNINPMTNQKVYDSCPSKCNPQCSCKGDIFKKGKNKLVCKHLRNA